MDDLRIPKVPADIVCHTIEQETIQGEIFLDVLSSAGYTLPQVLDFFNSPVPFFPFRISQSKSVLIHKEVMIRVDLPGLFHEYESEVSSLLDLKREATLHFKNSVELQGRFIIDLPQDHARILDLLNAGRRFVPFLLDEMLTLIHTHHIYKVDES